MIRFFIFQIFIFYDERIYQREGVAYHLTNTTNRKGVMINITTHS
jgi:hypothetical protein